VSALRISDHRDGSIRFVDLGPATYAIGPAGFHGSMVVGTSGTRERPPTDADRLRDWRKRHGLTGKQRLGDKA
jgi:hypothetical protein